jgi:cytoskeletal protein RodZ
VSIGATLAAARRRAGLTVNEVSQRTRVRESIVRNIEQDDYGACGGDFYARGHVRAIARAVGEDPRPLIDEFDSRWRSAKDVTAAEAFDPVMPLRIRERRRVRWTAALAVVALAVIGFAGYMLASDIGHTRHTAAAAAAAAQRPARQGGQPGSAAARTPAVRVSTARASPASTPSASPVTAQALTPASVAAFGPDGTADGDDPQNAALAVGDDPVRPWYSDWYTTPDFGKLQAGTGLLLDMGRTVTITSVRLSLSGEPGADLQLRAGGMPVLADLPPVASSAGAGGTVQLQLTVPVRARYLLIWFTKLPPDASGTYQANVYGIGVEGRP